MQKIPSVAVFDQRQRRSRKPGNADPVMCPVISAEHVTRGLAFLDSLRLTARLRRSIRALPYVRSSIGLNVATCCHLSCLGGRTRCGDTERAEALMIELRLGWERVELCE